MKKTSFILFVLIVSMILSGCTGSKPQPDTHTMPAEQAQTEEATGQPEETKEPLAEEQVVSEEETPVSAACWEDLIFDRTMELIAANQFSVSYSKEGYKKIHVEPDQDFLLVPAKLPVPEDVPAFVTVLMQPLDQIYLVATAAMDYFRQLDSISHITLSSQKESGWYIPEAKEAMHTGAMQYAGKYSTPDYELILSSGCDLAIENTMIYHTPEVLEQMQKLGIPALVEKSSYEADPLGRMEWLKLYAALLDKEEEAETYFSSLMEELDDVLKEEATDKVVAFFYINSTGAVNVRKSGDYVAKAIAMAGGRFLSFDESEEENALSTMTIQMESFYAGARDADVLIYNSTIDGELQTIGQLLAKSSLLKDFKAVQEGNVWCIEKNFYQESLELGNMILDVHKILTEDNVDEESLHFLHKLTDDTQ